MYYSHLLENHLACTPQFLIDMTDYKYYINGVLLAPPRTWYAIGDVVTIQWNVIEPDAAAADICYVAIRPLSLGYTDNAVLTGTSKHLLSYLYSG